MLNKEECLKEIHNLERYIGREFECLQVMFECEKSLDVLEQLINEYFELKEKVKRMNWIERNFESMKKLNEYLIQEHEKINEALDKACEELEKLDESHAYECNKQIIEKKGSSTITFGYQTKGEWKEYLLKEVKEDD